MMHRLYLLGLLVLTVGATVALTAPSSGGLVLWLLRAALAASVLVPWWAWVRVERRLS